MEETLRRMRQKANGEDRGFTLIELLVVVVIIGVLVAIAVPMYLNYRKGAANKSAQSDVRGAVSAIEQFYTENGNAYPKTGNNGVPSTDPAGKNLIFGSTSTGIAGAGGTTETATVSDGNYLSFVNNGASYWICGYNKDGGTIYFYNSSTGGSVGKSSQTTYALCVTNGT
jgi:type IV pilus assembly protein PilA